ncbi:MAG: hypothetical protein M8866_00045 [marine benthic group bacterium]|nr:hypothetical protein [Candidatus Benthicola marisminoris]
MVARSRLVALVAPCLLGLFSTAPAIGQQGETFRPGFGWQPGMRIQASESRVGVIREGAVSDSGRISTATYDIVVSEHRDGLLISHENMRVERIGDFPPEATPIMRVNEVVADNLTYWMRLPNLVVTDRGEFIRVDDLEGFRFRVESSIRPVASALAGGDEEILALLDQMLAAVVDGEVIESLASDRWSSLVDKWAYTDWQIGAVFAADIEHPNPLVPGPPILYSIRAGVTEKKECRAPSGGFMCAVFVMVTRPADAAIGEAARVLADSLGTQLVEAAGSEVPAEYVNGTTAPLIFEELRLESRVELMSDPVSLLPVWLEERQTRAGRGTGLGEPFSFFTEEVLTTEFAYAEDP